jgi:hypothetical protein
MSLRSVSRALGAMALAVGLVAPAAVARAAAPTIDPLAPGAGASRPADDPLQVFVMTMGPGDHPFLRFGHDAIWIRDHAARTDKVYNFGTFRFDSPRLILDFLGGRLSYWLSVSPLPRVIAEYTHENRDIVVQELALSPAKKAELRAALDVNARPENRRYKYDYFLDNCSTRVRDAVDRVAGGVLYASSGRQPGRMTLREHALRMTAQPFWLYLSLDLVLGPKVDQPISQWAEMFLPAELAHGLDAVDLQGGTGDPALLTRGGQPRKTPAEPFRVLVSGQAQLFRADRPPIAANPPSRVPAFLFWGVVVGLLFAALGWGGTRTRWARIPFGVVLALWGLATGFVGTFLVYAWMLTDHVVAHRNQNILLCAPWALAHLVLGIGVAMGRPGATRKAFVLAAVALGAVLIACLMKVGFVAHQQNGRLIAFFLPAWAGVTAGLWVLRRGPGRAPDDDRLRPTEPGTSRP